MRRGWHENWDGTERRVWTGFAIAWAGLLGWWLVCYVLGSTGIVPDAVMLFVPQWTWETLFLSHGFAYAVMWLRRMFVKPTGPERDR